MRVGIFNLPLRRPSSAVNTHGFRSLSGTTLVHRYISPNVLVCHLQGFGKPCEALQRLVRQLLCRTPGGISSNRCHMQSGCAKTQGRDRLSAASSSKVYRPIVSACSRMVSNNTVLSHAAASRSTPCPWSADPIGIVPVRCAWLQVPRRARPVPAAECRHRVANGLRMGSMDRIISKLSYLI